MPASRRHAWLAKFISTTGFVHASGDPFTNQIRKVTAAWQDGPSNKIAIHFQNYVIILARGEK